MSDANLTKQDCISAALVPSNWCLTPIFLKWPQERHRNQRKRKNQQAQISPDVSIVCEFMVARAHYENICRVAHGGNEGARGTENNGHHQRIGADPRLARNNSAAACRVSRGGHPQAARCLTALSSHFRGLHCGNDTGFSFPCHQDERSAEQ